MNRSVLTRLFLAPLFGFGLMLIGPVSSAQNSAEVDAAIEQAMQALDEFMLAFNRRDPEAWAATLNYPHVRFASGNVTV